ncbi:MULTISPECIES: sigma-54 interaction domain-containing protein [Chelativorans]|nr:MULTISPECIES: sigma 54-interacting transcriptional regulator [Chelativorans]
MTHSDGEHVHGIAVIDPTGAVQFHAGAASDMRVRAMISDPAWLAEAAERRLSALTLNDQSMAVLAVPFVGGHFIALFEERGATAIKFLLNVDFAFDIIEQLLSDPYDGMAIINADERLVYVSPVHEKFFGLEPGGGIGRKVRDVIENTRLHIVVRTGIAEIGQIQKMNGSERVVSRLPVRRGGKIVGAIGRVMFKGPQQVEALARRISALEQEIATYKSEQRKHTEAEKYLSCIIGQSEAMVRLRDQIRKIAPLDIPVLVQGESGTGKELVARALHMMSPRRDARLVNVNAAALPAQLVESELFGYEGGAFTGADRKGRAGKFELADKGTIFLDEIGDMPLETQSKLLRILQDRVVERVGGATPKKIDFRLCSATNRDLADFVETGRFRLDLFYRISPIIIQIPPLADRLEDIPLLLAHFLKELSAQHGRDVPEVDSNVSDYLMERSWPGNVRELFHNIERALVFCDNGKLRIENFQEAERMGRAAPREASVVRTDTPGSLRDTLDRVEQELVVAALDRFHGNKKKAAEYLGISRSYLYKKLSG